MNDFDELMNEIEAEARESGPEAMEELQRFQDQFRLASQILTLRREEGLTQAELSERSGVQQADISRIERGDMAPTGPTFAKLAHALGVEFGFYRAAGAGRAEPVRPTVTSPARPQPTA